MSGTAAFQISRLDMVQEVAETAVRYGYKLNVPGERIVLIGSNDGVHGEDMPERFASAFKNAVLIAVIA